MRLRLERLDRERNEALIRSVHENTSEGDSEAVTGIYEFGAQDRVDEVIAADRKAAEDRVEATGGAVLATEPFVYKVLAHASMIAAEAELDVLNSLLDPVEKTEGVITMDAEPKRKPLPKWIVRTGVKEEK